MIHPDPLQEWTHPWLVTENIHYNHGYIPKKLWLLGGIPTYPLKNICSSVGMMKFPTYGK